jgi:hypothetical protein
VRAPPGSTIVMPICERETAPERTRSLPAGKHVAEQHDSVVNRLRSEFVLHHATDRSVDMLESNVGDSEGAQDEL